MPRRWCRRRKALRSKRRDVTRRPALLGAGGRLHRVSAGQLYAEAHALENYHRQRRDAKRLHVAGDEKNDTGTAGRLFQPRLEGLKTLYDCRAMEVQLCNQVGHFRPEEGTEHYFAYAVENEMGHGRPDGDLVGPAILLVAKLQGQGTS